MSEAPATEQNPGLATPEEMQAAIEVSGYLLSLRSTVRLPAPPV